MKRKKPPLGRVLDLYDAYLRDDNTGRVAAAMGVTSETVLRWISNYPEFIQAKEVADSRRVETSTFSKYVFQRLSEQAKAVWEDIEFAEEHDSSYEKINQILSGRSTKMRQELFIHALVASNFDLSSACRKVCIPHATLMDWKKDDDFRQLIEEIQWHKKNFFERALLDLVQIKNPTAVVFANRTINADRGYTEKLQVEHSGSVSNGGLSMEQLEPYLDLETKKKILLAMRQAELAARTEPLQIAAPADIEA